MKYPLRVSGLFAFVVALVVLLPARSSLGFASPQHDKTVEDPAITATAAARLLRVDQSGLQIELNTPSFVISEQGSLKIDGLQQAVVEPGAPNLPYYSTFVALPPEAEVSVTVTRSNLATRAPIDVPPALQERLWVDPASADVPHSFQAGSLRELSPLQQRNSLIYGADADYPGILYTVSHPMILRDLRLVELKLFPLQYNPLTKTVSQAGRLTANIRFAYSGSYPDQQETVPREGANSVWQAQIINYDQAQSWRRLPRVAAESDLLELPVGRDVFKIEVNQDGIYELSGADLAAQGMALPVDPATINMMQQGEQVAFQFVDTNGNHNFDAADKLRFYGWPFAGSRQEKMYVSNNVFWLWSQDSGQTIPVIDNQNGLGSIVTSFRDSVTRWEENYFSSAWSIHWDENEPTAWHTQPVSITPGATTTESFAIDLPDPDPDGANPAFVVELTTRLRRPTSGSSTISFEAQARLNASTQFAARSWVGPKNLNVKGAASAAALKQPGDAGYPSNQVELKLNSSSPTPLLMLLTRIRVDYTRRLAAVNDQLAFGRQESGPSTFKLSGFSNAVAGNVLAWDISNPHAPKQISLSQGDITGSGANHTYSLGVNHGANARFLVTTSDNLLTVNGISRYVPVPIDPPSGGASWLALTHASLRSAAESLATYRSTEMGAYVIDVEDVVNQIGYGFNTPDTIRQYLRYAISSWTPAPKYVTLFGDATNNPRNLDCAGCPSWDKDTPTLVVTDFVFEDRWQGMIPSDFALSLLFGDDLLADVAISRVPANSLTEANVMVQKIINYDNQRAGEEVPAWTQNLLFVADNKDEGGDFCLQNKSIEPLIAGTFQQTHLCLQEPTAANINNLRSQMRSEVSDKGVSILNYRGHGSDSQWGGFNNEPAILSKDDVDFWENSGRSVVLLSADCLDGYFILNDDSALGETFMRLNNRGSVAHWSSSGIGYSSEHTILHRGFYEGIFRFNQNKLGDAVNFAKSRYYQSGKHESELYAFILLGDAAMDAVPQQELQIFMPVAYTP